RGNIRKRGVMSPVQLIQSPDAPMNACKIPREGRVAPGGSPALIIHRLIAQADTEERRLVLQWRRHRVGELLEHLTRQGMVQIKGNKSRTTPAQFGRLCESPVRKVMRRQ